MVMTERLEMERDGAESALGFYAVKVRSAGEALVAGALRQKGFEVLAPTYVDHRRYSDRVRKANCALFPGYIFVKMDVRELMPLVSTTGVSYVVKHGTALAPLPDQETAAIRSLCRSHVKCLPCAPLQAGQRVLINSGPLEGLQGILVKTAESSRVVLSINTIFQSVTVDIRDTKISTLD